MSKIESIKSYEGQVLDNIFFRPMLTGPNAEALGIKVMYNVPTPTTLHFWRRSGDILQKFNSCGWTGGSPADKFQKKIDLKKVKAEMAYSSEDYFSTVYELITNRPDVNLDDLSGTELEEAETALFRASIAESIRATMWYGNEERSNGGGLTTFDGLLKAIMQSSNNSAIDNAFGYVKDDNSPAWAEALLKKLWDDSHEELKSLRSEGQLAFFVTSDVYNAYEESLDNVALEAAYLAKQNGRERLFYRGVPVIDVQLNGYHDNVVDLPHSFAILTDRRNLALAVNTNDFPGTEVRMWYNPDVMENRQRAIFMAGCDYLLPELVTIAVGAPIKSSKLEVAGDTFEASFVLADDFDAVESVEISTYSSEGKIEADSEVLAVSGNNMSLTYEGITDIESYLLRFYYHNGMVADVTVKLDN